MDAMTLARKMTAALNATQRSSKYLDVTKTTSPGFIVTTFNEDDIWQVRVRYTAGNGVATRGVAVDVRRKVVERQLSTYRQILKGAGYPTEVTFAGGEDDPEQSYLWINAEPVTTKVAAKVADDVITERIAQVAEQGSFKPGDQVVFTASDNKGKTATYVDMDTASGCAIVELRGKQIKARLTSLAKA